MRHTSRRNGTTQRRSSAEQGLKECVNPGNKEKKAKKEGTKLTRAGCAVLENMILRPTRIQGFQRERWRERESRGSPSRGGENQDEKGKTEKARLRMGSGWLAPDLIKGNLSAFRTWLYSLLTSSTIHPFNLLFTLLAPRLLLCLDLIHIFFWSMSHLSIEMS